MTKRNDYLTLLEARDDLQRTLDAERALSDALAEALRNVDILLEGRGTADANDLPLGSSAGCAPLGEWIAHTLSRYDAARGAK